MGRFEELKVWQKGVSLAIKVYQITSDGKISKDYGMRDQMRRSAVSIPSNIAEGDELGTQKQSIRHFYIAKGSSAELMTQTLITEKVGYIKTSESLEIRNECRVISSMLQKLINSRKAKM